MATYTDRVIKQLVPDELRQIAVWRKAFTRPHTAAETLRLERLSAGVDLLCSGMRRICGGWSGRPPTV